jgi:5-formyltetrahydrofolate cyclo-ligase
MDSASVNKSALRRRMAAIRDAIPADERLLKSTAIAQRLSEWPSFVSAAVVFTFLSTRSEVATEIVNGFALAAGKTVAAPRTLLEEKRLEFRVLRGVAGELVAGAFGILEPRADAPLLKPDQADVVFVPGLAFDPHGFRLGYGGGFYDRLLAEAAVRAATVGLAFEEQVIESVPHDESDLPISFIATERRIIECPRRGQEGPPPATASDNGYDRR